MSENSNSRGLLKSMLLIGGAQSVKILNSIIRAKALALLVGPTGIGLLSILQNLQDMAVNLAALGIRNSGVRELASSKEDEESLSRVRQVLFAALLIQGVIAAAAIWLLRKKIAVWSFGDPSHATAVGLVGLGVFFSLIAGSQTTLLQGLRQIRDLARVTVWGAIAGTIGGLSIVWHMGQEGLVWLIVFPPLISILIALRYTRRLPMLSASPMTFREKFHIWRPMVKLGIAFMLGAMAHLVTQLFVRSHIARELGLDSAGQFAAAWSITFVYVGFLLNAMGADYFPRLTGVIRDYKTAAQMMNDQAQLSLVIGGPLLLVLIGTAPWLINLLYSKDFDQAATIVQWQSVGNLFKLASWSIGFSFTAAGMSGVFLFLQISFNILFLSGFWLAFPVFGLEAVGISYLFAFALHFVILNIFVRRLRDFKWQRLSVYLIASYLFLSIGLLAISSISPATGAYVSIVGSTLASVIGLRIVLKKLGPGGKLPNKLSQIFETLGWPIKHD